MNKHDFENLKFLLSTDKKGLHRWMNQATDDDFKYAMELIDTYTRGLSAHWNELADLDPELFATNPNQPYAEAQAVLAKFRLQH